ncbi:diguanylate cyclase [uncultured Robinsoniella sp.]|uniref:diguanylate cyclase n=1 Tax=uncultured Robinsoniella sp. TaxID=904190 RepID=UPI00374F803E
MKSLKTKVIALVLGCMLLSSFVIGSFSILSSKKAVSEDSAQIMNLLCENKSKEISALLSRIEQSVNTLTLYASRQIVDTDKFKKDSSYVDQFTEHLTDIAINAAANTEGAMTVYIRYNPEYTSPTSGLFCSKSSTDSTFKSLEPTNLSLYDPSDTSRVGWFYEPAKNKKGTWMEPYLNDNINIEMISYVIPFYANDVFIGVVGMDIDFSVLQTIVEETTVYENGYAYLTDENANLIYHQDLPRGTSLMDYNNGEFRAAAEALLKDSSQESLITYNYHGYQRKASFRSLQNGMRLVLAAPTSDIDKQANQLILQILIASFVIVALTIIFTFIFTRRLVKPLLELTDAAQKIAAGDLSISITHHSKDEVGTLAESFRETVKHLHKYISYINELAYRDPLTGVKNKTAYLEVANQMDELARLKRPEFAVIVFDINGLKTVNDTYGHDFGDILIADTCKIICNTFKQSPIYRIGGDEFVALLEKEDYKNSIQLLSQMQHDIDVYNEQPHNKIKISVAKGIAVYSEATDFTFQDVFKRADNAMYFNKAKMKSQNDKK